MLIYKTNVAKTLHVSTKAVDGMIEAGLFACIPGTKKIALTETGKRAFGGDIVETLYKSSTRRNHDTLFDTAPKQVSVSGYSGDDWIATKDVLRQLPTPAAEHLLKSGHASAALASLFPSLTIRSKDSSSYGTRRKFHKDSIIELVELGLTMTPPVPEELQPVAQREVAVPQGDGDE